MSVAIGALTVPALAQQPGAANQPCRQQLTELERQMANAPQERRAELDRMMRDARTAMDRNSEAECVRIVGDIRKIVPSQAAAAGGAQGAQIQVQQPAPQVTVERQAPEVTVQQPAPQVTVQQPQPQVTVQQPQPQVTVQQPRPEVTVQQARPEVTVQQQGQPQVTVQRQGEPQVTVQRQGEPQVNVQQQGQARTQAQQQAQTPTQPREPAAGAAATGAASWYGQMRAEQLIGKDIYGAQGQEIGEIQDIVLNRNARATAALVDVGGFLGIGARRVAIPMDQLQMQGDRITAAALTKEQVERMAEYREAEWERFDRTRPLGATVAR